MNQLKSLMLLVEEIEKEIGRSWIFSYHRKKQNLSYRSDHQSYTGMITICFSSHFICVGLKMKGMHSVE